MISATLKQSLPALIRPSRTVAVCLLFLGILWMSQASAKADTITFEHDPLGIFPNGSRSVESNLVRFSASGAGGLIIGPELGAMEFLGTRGLAVQGTPFVHLIMDFATPVNSLSLWFGNDDPHGTVPGDTAILRVFLDGSLVGEATVLMNRDDFIDQQISFSGVVFNSADFHFSQEFFLTETVDNIEFTPVPEPASIALLGIGIVGIITRIRSSR
jgi:PEP-CTERM motif